VLASLAEIMRMPWMPGAQRVLLTCRTFVDVLVSEAAPLSSPPSALAG
jgi:hypothetical protein